YEIKDGFAVIDRIWKKGDVIECTTPMQVRQIVSRAEVKENKDRMALQYGPLVYCVEGYDNGGQAWNFILSPQPGFTTQFEPELLGGVNTISFVGKAVDIEPSGSSLTTRDVRIKAIPYFTWNNRGPAHMQVWLPTRFSLVRVNPN
ncbi:MAG TPA: hypothetical protein VK907_09085, partial [Phnomibacter sp.]|nr:hypothetical protein [Phnomibacter sp.]